MPVSEQIAGINRRRLLQASGLIPLGLSCSSPALAERLSPTPTPIPQIRVVSDHRRIIVASDVELGLYQFGYQAKLVHAGDQYTLCRPGQAEADWHTRARYVAACPVDSRRLALLDHAQRRIDIFNTDGEFQSSWDIAAYCHSPRAVTSHDDALWLSDASGHQLLRFDHRGQYISSFGDNQLLNGPVDFTVDGDGQLHLLEAGAGRISVWSERGQLIDHYAEQALDAGAKALVYDSASRGVMVLNNWRQTVTLFSTNGDLAGNTELAAGHNITAMSLLPAQRLYLTA